MQYNPKVHNRRSIRLKGYDYRQVGCYFITICCQNRKHLFGKIVQGEMKLNPAGEMIQKWYFKIQEKFPEIKCHEMIIMPNHFHCIIQNTVGIDPRVDPNIINDVDPNSGDNGEHMGSPRRQQKSELDPNKEGTSLSQVVQWFKTMTTNEYIRGVKEHGWQRFNRRLWQRNYYEQIIRNELVFFHISNYIKNNPKNWKENRFS